MTHSAFILPADSEFSIESHRAGSLGDQALANKIQKKFNEYGLTTWSDEHFVKVQEAPASGYNKFSFKDASEERPQSFLSYSPSQRVTVMKKLLSVIISLKLKMAKSQKIHFFLCVCVFWSRVPSCMRSTGRRVTLTSCRKVVSRWTARSCWSGLERSALLRRLASFSNNGQLVVSSLALTCERLIDFSFFCNRSPMLPK